MSRWTVALIAVLILLPGCVFVTEPLSDPDKAEADKKLFGKWESDGSRMEISCPAVKGNPKGLMFAAIPPAYSGDWFFTTTIGKNTYWNIICDGDFRAEGAYERWNKRDDRYFQVIVAKLDENRLILTYGDEKTVKGVMKAEMIPEVEQKDGQKDIHPHYKTAPGRLAKYLEKNGPEKLYSGGRNEEWRRVKAWGKE